MFSQRTKALCVAAATVATGFDAHALEVRGDFRQGLTKYSKAPASAKEWWSSHVVRVEGVTAIALGNGAFATARHLGAPTGASDIYRVRDQQGLGSDVILFRHSSHAHLPNLPIVEERRDTPFSPQPLVLATPTKQGLTFPSAPVRFEGEFPDFGRTAVSRGELILSTPLDSFTGGAVVEHGDSGSGVFYFDDSKGSWQLAGILVAWLKPSEPSEQTHNLAVAIDTSAAQGISKQLLDYRDGQIRGGLTGGEWWEWARHHRTGISAAFGLLLGASGLLCARLTYKICQQRPEVSDKSPPSHSITSKY